MFPLPSEGESWLYEAWLGLNSGLYSILWMLRNSVAVCHALSGNEHPISIHKNGPCSLAFGVRNTPFTWWLAQTSTPRGCRGSWRVYTVLSPIYKWGNWGQGLPAEPSSWVYPSAFMCSLWKTLDILETPFPTLIYARPQSVVHMESLPHVCGRCLAAVVYSSLNHLSSEVMLTYSFPTLWPTASLFWVLCLPHWSYASALISISY